MSNVRWLHILVLIAPCLGDIMAPPGSNHNMIYDDSDLNALDLLLKNYDRRVTPEGNKKPTTVTVTVYLRSFGSVNPETMDYEVDLYLRQTWRDDRMTRANLSRALDLNDPQLVRKLWKPDVYFPNAKHGEFQYVTVPNVLFRIEPNGTIQYVLRLKLIFACMMNMQRYPLDSQTCNIELASFSKTTREVILDWDATSGVMFYEDLKIAQFQLKNIKLTNCREPFHIGEYSCLRAELDLKRSIGHYLVQSYLPTTLIVVVSWVSFWLQMDAIPARITLGVTTLLTITSESSDQQGNVAPVSYVKALDVWQGTCTMFVFAALLEFTVVSCLARRKPRRKRAKSSSKNNLKQSRLAQLDNVDSGGDLGHRVDLKCVEGDNSISVRTRAPHEIAKAVDKWSRVIFPLCFIMFNMFYWPYYLYVE